MRSILTTYLPWVLSCITIYMTVLAGNKSRHAWFVGLIGQTLWFVWIVSSKTWGMLPMNAALCVVYLRNYFLWSGVTTQGDKNGRV